MLEMRRVSYTYTDGTVALRDLSFVLQAGERVGLVGANGAGKSTLLLHLNGCLFPSAGELWVAGQLLSKATLPDIRRKVGLVFQDPDDQLFMPSVEEDVAFGPLQHGLDEAQVEEIVATVLKQVSATHLRHRPPYRLSAGEKRSVAIAAVLASSPQLLVLDEPSSHLDPRARRSFIQLLTSLPQTQIIASHDLELIVETCSRVLLLSQGRLIADGPVRTLLGDEALMLAHGLERPHILLHSHPHPTSAATPSRHP